MSVSRRVDHAQMVAAKAQHIIIMQDHISRLQDNIAQVFADIYQHSLIISMDSDQSTGRFFDFRYSADMVVMSMGQQDIFYLELMALGYDR